MNLSYDGGKNSIFLAFDRQKIDNYICFLKASLFLDVSEREYTDELLTEAQHILRETTGCCIRALSEDIRK